MNKEIGKIYETHDYSMFKQLEGNRTDAISRAAKIIKSIRQNGYILSPIAINEKNEVIDGQARLYALECEALPVHYYVVPGAGVDECIAMNIYGTKWKIQDYIQSYANRGNESYIRFAKLKESYPQFDLNIDLVAATAKYGNGSFESVKNGTFTLTEEEFEKATKRLDYCKRAKDEIGNGKMQGRVEYLYRALIFLFDYCNGQYDLDRIITRLGLLYSQMSPIVDTASALKSISEIYNYRSKSEKKYFDVDYDRYMCNTVPGYSGKWSKAKG